MNTELKIEIADEQTRSVDQDRLGDAVEKILTDHGFHRCEISIALVTDPQIHEYNRTYLNHDYPTDVISFPLAGDRTEGFLSGQLIVSTDTAASVAERVGIAWEDELLLYVIHGTLHLVGYDDKDPDAEKEMRRAEEKWMKAMGAVYEWTSDEADA